METEFFNQSLGFQFNDGGRAEAGFKGTCRDCGVRAAAIALSLPYKEVYDELNSIRKDLLSKARSPRVRKGLENSVREGTAMAVLNEFMARHGWVWVPKMHIGSGCTTHLYDLPMGRFVCRVAKHCCAVIDRTIHDIFRDNEERCVYGYWVPKS